LKFLSHQIKLQDKKYSRLNAAADFRYDLWSEFKGWFEKKILTSIIILFKFFQNTKIYTLSAITVPIFQIAEKIYNCLIVEYKNPNRILYQQIIKSVK